MSARENLLNPQIDRLDADMFISDDGKSLDAFNKDENTSSLKASKDSPSYIDNVNPSLTQF